MSFIPFGGNGTVWCYLYGAGEGIVVFDPLTVWFGFWQPEGYYDPDFFDNWEPGTSPLFTCHQLIHWCDPVDSLVWVAEGCKHQVTNVYEGYPNVIPGCECCQSPCTICGWSDCPSPHGNGQPCCYGPGDTMTYEITWGAFSSSHQEEECRWQCNGGSGGAVYEFTGYGACGSPPCDSAVFGEPISGDSCFTDYVGSFVCKCCVPCPSTSLGGFTGPIAPFDPDNIPECVDVGHCAAHDCNSVGDPNCWETAPCWICVPSDSGGQGGDGDPAGGESGKDWNSAGHYPPTPTNRLASPYLWRNNRWEGATGMHVTGNNGEIDQIQGGVGGGLPSTKGISVVESINNPYIPLCCGVSAELCLPYTNCTNFSGKLIRYDAGCNGDYECCSVYFDRIRQSGEPYAGSCDCDEWSNSYSYTASTGNCTSTQEQKKACWVWNGLYFETIVDSDVDIYCCRPKCEYYDDPSLFVFVNNYACIPKDPYANGICPPEGECYVQLFYGCVSGVDSDQSMGLAPSRPSDITKLEWLSHYDRPSK